ncbi:guanine nucleotide-binding protein subunit gamma 2-like [Phoenix dactylifera]|uniref:Guanine nucleotide-binding protein subunit gamma 2-like n=1 Tax=Phoenix dactylifera TaxID=42345 RepID=A0A8B7BHF3_PHODC|nr:guanine nucleotide-binding protein subunit gamma 2-like [Phoenix dactylifera]
MTTRRMRCEEEVEATAVKEGGSLGEGEARPSSRLPTPRTGDFLGRHRLSAAINRLNQEIHSLQEELDKLDSTEPSSAACKEVLVSTEGIPDALLPVTSGPEIVAWNRWFERVRSSHGHKWWA